MDLNILKSDKALALGEGQVGGKALGLAKLQGAGARVPEWFVVPAEAFRAHVAAAGLELRIAQTLAKLSALDPTGPEARKLIEDEASALRAAIEAAPLADGLVSAVRAGVAALGKGPFAVRSSMVGEDSASHSFAGQCDTFLFQPDADAVLDALRRCFGSAFTARALSYRLRAGAQLPPPAMAVVVQRMIDGQVSGVLFTANPVSRRRDEVLLTAAWGLGEGIVSGVCNTDEYVLGHDGKERAVRLAEKDVQVVRNDNGIGTKETEVPAERHTARCLPAERAAQISQEGVRLAEAFGAPQDVEWTLDGDTVYLLQARPITSPLAPAPSPDAPRVVWNNSNIQESYCGVTTPLTFSFALGAYASVYEQTYRILGLSEDELKAMRPTFAHMLGLMKGRVFYNINNWYRVLLILPSFGRNKTDMEKMMGLDETVDFIEDQKFTRFEKAMRAPKLLMTLARLKGYFRKLDEDVLKFLADFDASVGRIDRAKLAKYSLSELMALENFLRDDMLGRWHTPIINDFYVMMSAGALRRLVTKHFGAERTPEMWNRLVAGEEGIESTEPTRRLMRMAKTARGDARLAATIREGAPEAAMKKVRETFPAFSAELDRYLDRYGDRCMGELKLESISLREDASFLIKILRNYLDRADLDADKLAEHERQDRRQAEGELEAKLSPLEKLRLPGILRDARKSIKYRENLRLARTRLFGVIRDLYQAAGHRLHEAGRLEAPRDVFYLTVEEIKAFHDGTAVSTDLAGLARLRKAEFAAYELDDVPNHFETAGAAYLDMAPPVAAPTAEEQNKKILSGLGCSPGKVEAPLRVIAKPSDELDLTGKILTALRTDPGWGPLFPSASGILVERGSALSHSAVLARELGIPAVVGVPRLLALVSDGETVKLDGSAGTVERLGK